MLHTVRLLKRLGGLELSKVVLSCEDVCGIIREVLKMAIVRPTSGISAFSIDDRNFEETVSLCIEGLSVNGEYTVYSNYGVVPHVEKVAITRELLAYIQGRITAPTYKMYVWEDFCTDWTPGLMCVLAHDLEEAIQVAVEKYGPSGSKEYLYLHEQLRRWEYKVITIPEAFGVSGGS